MSIMWSVSGQFSAVATLSALTFQCLILHRICQDSWEVLAGWKMDAWSTVHASAAITATVDDDDDDDDSGSDNDTAM